MPPPLSVRRVNLIDMIRDQKQRIPAKVDHIVFMGPTRQDYSSHGRLQKTGRAMTQKVFNPPNPGPTEGVNAFMVENLTLIDDHTSTIIGMTK